jgi:putative PIN family toxin of toxin-antitoxin system
VRVCLDTNVLVAAFATRGLCADVVQTVLTEHELILGEAILAKFRRVLKTKLKAPEDRIASAEAVFSSIELLPKPKAPSSLPIPDRDDRWILATAVMGRADVLVTGDDDLLSVAAEASLLIVTPRAFWELLRRGEGR